MAPVRTNAIRRSSRDPVIHTRTNSSTHYQQRSLRPLANKRRTNVQQGSRIQPAGPAQDATSTVNAESVPPGSSSTRTFTRNVPLAQHLTRRHYTHLPSSGHPTRPLYQSLAFPGSSLNALIQLPTIIVNEKFLTDAEESEKVCTICMEGLEIGDVVTKLGCGHVFHKGFDITVNAGEVSLMENSKNDCQGILCWLKEKSSCPQCRKSIETEPRSGMESTHEFDLSANRPSANSQEEAGERGFSQLNVPVSMVAPILRGQRDVIYRQNHLLSQQHIQIQRLQAALGRAHAVFNSRMCQSRQPTGANRGTTIAFQQTLQGFQNTPGESTSSPRRPWQNPARDLPERMRVVMDVMKITRDMFLKGRERAGGAPVLENSSVEGQEEQRLYLVSKKVEAHLYRFATSSSEYSNRVTLASRVTRLVRQL